jgi:hypothetical protein
MSYVSNKINIYNTEINETIGLLQRQILNKNLDASLVNLIIDDAYYITNEDYDIMNSFLKIINNNSIAFNNYIKF